MDAKNLIEEGKSYLGIEFGSTRIKGVVIDAEGNVLATGGHSWENRFDNGVWTYTLDDIWCIYSLSESFWLSHSSSTYGHTYLMELSSSVPSRLSSVQFSHSVMSDSL